MKRKILALLAAVVCTSGPSGAYGQFGISPIKRPNIANIFHPVVGVGAAYEQTDQEGKKFNMEMSIVGSEMVGVEKGYWMEVAHTRGADEPQYAKVLVTPDDFAFHKIVMMMPGSNQPMEMDMDSGMSHKATMYKNLEKWHSVATETISVPAGTFS